MAEVSTSAESSGELAGTIAAHLNTKQLRILEMLANGQTYRDIGECLFLTEAAIAYHVRRLQAHFLVPNNAALIAAAFVAGILSADRWPVRSSVLIQPGRIEHVALHMPELATRGGPRAKR